jgi:hypothetical protein
MAEKVEATPSKEFYNLTIPLFAWLGGVLLSTFAVRNRRQ